MSATRIDKELTPQEGLFNLLMFNMSLTERNAVYAEIKKQKLFVQHQLLDELIEESKPLLDRTLTEKNRGMKSIYIDAVPVETIRSLQKAINGRSN